MARHPVNQNEIAVFDLSADPEPLLVLDAEQIRQRVFTRIADLPDGVARIPLKTVHLNRCPILVPLNTLRTADAERLGIDLGRCQTHLAALKNAQGLTDKLAKVFTKPATEAAETNDPDLMIYSGGFFNHTDKAKMHKLRSLSPSELATATFSFDDKRLPEMLFRYRARNWPETLNPTEKNRWEQFRRDYLTQKKTGGEMVLAEYAARLSELENQSDISSHHLAIISELRAWGQSLICQDSSDITQ